LKVTIKILGRGQGSCTNTGTLVNSKRWKRAHKGDQRHRNKFNMTAKETERKNGEPQFASFGGNGSKAASLLRQKITLKKGGGIISGDQ